MSTTEVAVIDYGVGNLLSVSRALARCGAVVSITSDPARILSAPRVVLPGVGAFANGMQELKRRGLDDVVREVAGRGVPLLAICLGMQMLMDESHEFGLTRGLGIIPGAVMPIPTSSGDGARLKVPHIGWSPLLAVHGAEKWEMSPLRGIRPGDAAYFVHSFMAEPTLAAHRIAECRYGSVHIAAAIGRGNVLGCQFHPEKSGQTGLRILREFVLAGS